ncbi:hypothetical protein AAFC00_005152 [Neodothiora populina]|uniref:Cytoskeletal adapter protein sagA n=1 Tax=Neodothiora populina TaxID=2781224 RepID=A0ABR3PKC4_9PEZI
MSVTTGTDINHPVLNLTAQEKQYYSTLFNQADTDSLGVVTGEVAVNFFEKTRVAPNVLGEIWQIADSENRGLLTKPGFCVALRLIGHYQAGRDLSPDLAFKQGPLPKFEGVSIPPPPAVAVAPPAHPNSPALGVPPAGALQPQGTGIRIPPMTPDKVAQYSGLFERSGAQNGQLAGESAKAIFERAGLPNEILGRIWGLSDREGKGSLDMTEFIIAMHLVSSYKSRTLTALPSVLPPGLYEAAARRGAPPPHGSRNSGSIPSAIPRQLTGTQRAQSPLARATYGTPPPPMSAQSTGGWLITPQEKAKYDQFFSSIDTAGIGHLSGDQAVRFFSDSGLPEDSLAQIWDLADINSEGRLSRDEFAVAMYLIRQERSKPAGGPPLPAFLPPALIPPSLRNQPRPAAQTTAPAFDNAANTSQFPKSATEDLFGLDSPPKPAASTPALSAQTTGVPPVFGAPVSKDPFGANASSTPVSPQKTGFAPTPAASSSMFKPFMPSSAFGASLAAQHTGGSNASSQPAQARAMPPPSVMDDLLGEAPEDETKNITTDTTELANMSNQIGNLRNQMQDVQTKKETHQRDLSATNNQKRDLEMRLQQFRASYEQEVRAVKTLEEQLTASRTETTKLQKDLAMIEGAYQDLSTQHQTIAQQLHADQQENVSLKQRISQLNAEIAQLKPQVEKMRSDARQQKGMVAINKKQLATNEGERGNLQTAMSTLANEAEEWERQKALHEERERQHEEKGRQLQEREAQLAEKESLLKQREQEHLKTVEQHQSRAAEEQTREIASPRSAVVSPAASVSTNPFFRGAGATSPTGSVAPNHSAFDALFGPSFSQQQTHTETPPAVSFPANESGQSVSSEGRPTPSVTPPISAAHDHEHPPPPPESRQFTPNNLPMGTLQREGSLDSSVRAAAPASIDNRSVATGPVSSPFDGPNAFEPSPFGHENLTTPPAQTSGPALQGIHAGQLAAEPTQLPTPLPESENMPGAFPEETATPLTTQTTGQGPEIHAPVARAATHDDFDSAFADFGDAPQSKGKEPAHDAFNPVEHAHGSSTNVNDEFPAIRELEDSDSDSSSEHGFDDDFSAGPSAGNGAPLEPVEAEHVEHVEHAAPSIASPVASGMTAPGPFVTAAALRPHLGEDSRAVSEAPSISAQVSPPSYDASVEHHAGSGQLPPEFGGLLPSREDPTQSAVPHSVPHQAAPHTPTTATSDVFHDAGSRPISTSTDLGAAAHAAPVIAAAATEVKAEPVHDDFDDFDDLEEAREATVEDPDFGIESEVRGDEFTPTFDSPSHSISTVHGPSASSTTNGFSGFEGNNGSHHHANPSLSTAFANTQPSQPSADWDAIFSGLDTSPAVNTEPTFPGLDPAQATSPVNSGPTTANMSGLPFPGVDNTREAGPSSSNLQPTKPALGRAITNTGEHDDPTVKRLVGMGFNRDKAVKALEDYDYNIEKAIDYLTSTA